MVKKNATKRSKLRRRILTRQNCADNYACQEYSSVITSREIEYHTHISLNSPETDSEGFKYFFLILRQSIRVF